MPLNCLFIRKGKTMKWFAVAFIQFGNSELEIEIVRASNMQDAIGMHSKIPDTMPILISPDLEKIKRAFFDQDAMIDVVEVVVVPL